MWKVPNMWEGATCFILGGGLSAPRVFGVPEWLIKKVVDGEMTPAVFSDYYKPIHGKHTIGINNAYQLGNWVDFCFFGDASWFMHHTKLTRKYRGMLVSCSDRMDSPETADWRRVKYLQKCEDEEETPKGARKKKYGLTSNRSQVVWNGNSGTAAINMAVHLGVKNIVLVGFDMKCSELDEKEVTHWHGYHREKYAKKKKAIKKPPFSRHMKGYPRIQAEASRMGVSIYNMSPISAIECLPKINLKQALEL